MKWLLCTALLFSCNIYAKILVLVVANDGPPVYTKLQKLWRSYMHLDREHVEVYFVKSDPHLKHSSRLQGDVLWVKTKESFVPGVLNKTILSFKAMLPRIKNEFDYVLRTNLSSFYVFPRLLQFVESLPKTGCYSALVADHVPGIRFGAGAGYILSPDVVEMIVEKRNALLDSTWQNDDVVIGKFLQDRQIEIIPAPRMDFYSLRAWLDHEGIYLAAVPYYPAHVVSATIPEDVFHFRVKQGSERLRLEEDIPVYKDLVKLFYGIDE